MGAAVSGLVFQPPSVSYAHASKHLIWLKSTDGSDFPGFFIDRKAKVTILFSHGNAEDIGMIYEWFTEFTKKLRVNLFAYDYAGYGKAAGPPSEQKCYDNIESAFEYLITQRRMSPESIVLYGRSLGSGPSCYLAEKLSRLGVSIGGLVLQSALLSVYRVAFYFRYTMWGDAFPNLDRIKNVACPVYVIHGTMDEIVPFWNGEDLFLNAPVQWRACPYWVEQAGHNNVETAFKEEGMFYKRFLEFLQDHVDAYSKKSVVDKSALDIPAGSLPRPPRAERTGNRGRSQRKPNDDDLLDTSSTALLSSGGSPYAIASASDSSSNLSSSSEDSSHELFPEVVSGVDWSMHGPAPAKGAPAASELTTHEHDIVLEGISAAAKEVEITELNQEFDQHFDVEPHNTI